MTSPHATQKKELKLIALTELQLKAADNANTAPCACGDDGEWHVMFHHVLLILASHLLLQCTNDKIS